MPTEPLRVLSVIPPMTQLNTPYPSTAYLTGFLRSRGIDAVQEDLALALVLQLFTPAGLEAVRGRALAQPEAQRSGSVHAFLDQFADYRSTIGPAIAYLQGRDSTLAHRIAARGLLPEGPRFSALDAYVADLTAGLAAIGNGLDAYVYGHIADGNLHIAIAAPGPLPHDMKGLAEDAVYAGIHASGGSFSAEHGVGLDKRAAYLTHVDPVKQSLSRQFKAMLDPDMLFNPGKVPF